MNSTSVLPHDTSAGIPSAPRGRAGSKGVLSGVLGGMIAAFALLALPPIELGLFTRGAAHTAGLLSGSPVFAAEGGWLLPAVGHPLRVSAVCSGTGFFLILCILLCWRLGRSGRPAWLAVCTGVALALPLALLVNAMRILLLAQAHAWLIPRLPDNYTGFAHMTVGVAVFLPALILLNTVFEIHEHHRRKSSARAAA